MSRRCIISSQSTYLTSRQKLIPKKQCTFPSATPLFGAYWPSRQTQYRLSHLCVVAQRRCIAKSTVEHRYDRDSSRAHSGWADLVLLVPPLTTSNRECVFTATNVSLTDYYQDHDCSVSTACSHSITCDLRLSISSPLDHFADLVNLAVIDQ